MSDNPRAFPSAAIDDGFGGMSLRDWFASQALAGLLYGRRASAETLADEAYTMADAMLEARKAKP
jgi:hypothetical protein